MAKYGFGLERTIPLGGFASVKVRAWAEFDDMDIDFDDKIPTNEERMEYVRNFVIQEFRKALEELGLQNNTAPARTLPEAE